MWPLRHDADTTRTLWRLSRPLILFAVSQYLLSVVDLYLVSLFRSSADVGHYSLAYQCYGMVLALAATIPAIVTPRLSRARLEDVRIGASYVDALTNRWIPVGALAATPLIPLVPIAMPFIFGHAYAASGEPATILAVGLLLLLAATALGPVLLVWDRNRVIGTNAVAMLGLNLFLDLILLGDERTGILGPAIATSVVAAVTWDVYRRAAEKAVQRRVARRTECFAAPAIAAILAISVSTAPAVIASAVVALLALFIQRRGVTPG